MPKIRYVDGFEIRNVFPDFDIVESHWTSDITIGDVRMPFIPKGEIWIDRRFRKETAFLLEVHRIERSKRRWPLAKIREYLKKRLVADGPCPPFAVRSRRRGRMKIRYVRGEIVRRYLDPCFIFGGHDLVYRYIPRGEIWVDIRQDPREMPFTIFHEMRERKLMATGASYAEAHRLTTEAEKSVRKRLRRAKANRPLKMRPFWQSAGFCGPASLKIAMSYFGRDYEEKYLGELCGATAEKGTDHEDMIRCAKTLGASVVAKSGGTFRELRKYVDRLRLPVIVGWYSPVNPRKPKPGEDHFSVVYHVTDTHILLMDPETESGRRRMTRKKFLSVWWDTDTPRNKRVERWFMVVNFERPKN